MESKARGKTFKQAVEAKRARPVGVRQGLHVWSGGKSSQPTAAHAMLSTKCGANRRQTLLLLYFVVLYEISQPVSYPSVSNTYDVEARVVGLARLALVFADARGGGGDRSGFLVRRRTSTLGE